LLLQADQRSRLHHLIRALTPVIASWPETRSLRWSLDIDPVDLY
jgi:primosomal protein N' (replication factor Y)